MIKQIELRVQKRKKKFIIIKQNNINILTCGQFAKGNQIVNILTHFKSKTPQDTLIWDQRHKGQRYLVPSSLETKILASCTKFVTKK